MVTAKLAPYLVALNEGPDIPLAKPIVLIGRHQECDVQIPSRKISRRHCCVAQVENYLVVRDLGSTNGIRINGTRVPEGKLNPGDELTIGNVRYEVRWLEKGAARPADKKAAARHDESSELPIALDDPPDARVWPLGRPPAGPDQAPDGAFQERPPLRLPNRANLPPLDSPSADHQRQAPG